MAQVQIWTKQAYRNRGYIDEPWLSGIERRTISKPEEIVASLNLAAKPTNERFEFVVVAEEENRRV